MTPTTQQLAEEMADNLMCDLESVTIFIHTDRADVRRRIKKEIPLQALLDVAKAVQRQLEYNKRHTTIHDSCPCPACEHHRNLMKVIDQLPPSLRQQLE